MKRLMVRAGSDVLKYQVIFMFLVFIALELVMASMGAYVFVSKTVLLPFFLYATYLNNDSRLFVRDWVLFLTWLIAFDLSRGLIYRLILALHLPIYSHYVIAFEKSILSCFKYVSPTALPQTFSSLLQSSQHVPHGISLLTKLCVLVYGSHFVYFLAVGFCIWRLRTDDFWRFKQAYLLCMALGLIGYLLIPTVPPWLAGKQGLIAPVAKTYAEVFNMTIPSLFHIFDINEIAAMPSLHMAFPTLASLILFYHFGRIAWFAVMYNGLVAFACVLVGAHYIVDLLVGVFLAIFCFCLIYRKEVRKTLISTGEKLTQEMLYEIVKAFIVFSSLMIVNLI